MAHITTEEELMHRFNAANGTPAEGHTSFVRLYGVNIDCETGVIEVHYLECFHGRMGKGVLRFASNENFQRYVEQHA